MKKLFKTIVALSAASAMMLSTTAFAHSVSTVTTYKDSTASVHSIVSGVEKDQMITYIATTADDTTGYAVNEDGSNIVYIGQKTSTDTTVTFDYALTGVTGPTYALVKSGSSAGTVTDDEDYVGIYDITVSVVNQNGDPVDNAVTVSDNEDVGVGNKAEITLTPASGYEIVKIVVDGSEVDVANNTISVEKGSTVVVTALPIATAGVYLLSGATVTDESGYVDTETSKNSAIVKVVGTVDYCYFIFSNEQGSYTIENENKFYVNGSESKLENGYYGVEIIGTKDDDVSAYKTITAKYKASDDTAESDATPVE